MKNLAFLLLCVGVLAVEPVQADALPDGFPTAQALNFEQLHAAFNFSPHTTARFEQVRTLPSGRVLRSRGLFEFRRGVGMMWRTESPVRNAMIISKSSLVLYGSKGQQLRHTDISESPAARYTTVFLDGARPQMLQDLTRAFHVTTSRSGDKLLLGLQAKHAEMDLRLLLVEVEKGDVRRVEYVSARQGRTVVQFKSVKNGQNVPTTPFKI